MGWTNTAGGVLQAITVIITAGTPNAGLFVYSGTPAFGNLIATIAATPGTDIYGNQYGAGLISYDQNADLFSQLSAGKVAVGALTGLSGSAPDTAHAAFFSSTGNGVTGLTSNTQPLTTFTDATLIRMAAGQPGQATGSGFNPFTRFIDVAGTSAHDVLVSGTVLAASLLGAAASWQTPVYAASWASTTSFGGLGGGEGLRFRFMAENDTWLYGLTTATGAGGTTVFTLPAGFFSTTHTTYGTALRNRGGVLMALNVAVSTAGAVIVGALPAAGDEYLWNMRLPLENVA